MDYFSDEYEQLCGELLSSAKELDIEVSERQAELLVRHLYMVLDKNKELNLTRIVDLHDGVIRHILDSLLFVPGIRNYLHDKNQSFIDIGTGAGFPGIPVAVVSGLRGLLIDSVAKKISALKMFVNELQIESLVQCHTIRAEDLARDNQCTVDFIVTRAVADIGVLVEYASPLLLRGGHLFASKGNPSKDEIDTGLRTAGLCGMSFVSRETFELPNNFGHREMFVFEKSSEPKIHLPRKTGMAKHRPL